MDDRKRPGSVLRNAADVIGKFRRSSERSGETQLRPQAESVIGQGRRESQQDAFAFTKMRNSSGTVFAAVLCDGMGGMADGREIAEETVRNALNCCFTKEDCRGEIIRISGEIYEKYRGNGGTTLVMIRIRGDMLEFWSVGDSDIMLLRKGRLYHINVRHTCKNELYLLAAAGRIEIDDVQKNTQRNALSQYMGAKNIFPDQFQRGFRLCHGDVLMLCSDGVSGTLNSRQLARLMQLPLRNCCDGIEREIAAADLPGQDNYSAVVIKI